MRDAKQPRQTAWATLLGALLVWSMTAPSALASEPPRPADPIIDALEEIETADWDNRWLGYNIALVGSAAGIGLGGWALYEQPLAQDGTPDPVVFASSLAILGAAMTQVVHGGMRFDERVQGATEARHLLAHEEDRKANAMFFLQNRANQARSTRFWGGIMTTTQGIGTTVLGARLWANGQDSIRTTGIVLTVLGALNTAIGAVHFPGIPRSERVLRRTQEALAQTAQIKVQPVPLHDGEGRWLAGLAASGRF